MPASPAGDGDDAHSSSSPSSSGSCSSCASTASVVANNQRARSTKAQFSLLISFMERNPLFARDEVDNKLYQDQWKELAINLNSIECEDRPVESWIRTWKDKTRLAKERSMAIASGQLIVPLTLMESRILNIIGHNININHYPKPNTSVEATKKSLKRPRDGQDSFSSDQNSPEPVKKRFVNETYIDVAKSNNNNIKELSTTLRKCLQEQNTILKEGLQQIQNSIAQMCCEIVQAFQIHRVRANVNQDASDVNTLEGDNHYTVEYLEDDCGIEYLKKF